MVHLTIVKDFGKLQIASRGRLRVRRILERRGKLQFEGACGRAEVAMGICCEPADARAARKGERSGHPIRCGTA